MEALTPDRCVVDEVRLLGLLDKTLAALEGTDEQFSAEAVVDEDRAKTSSFPSSAATASGCRTSSYETRDGVRDDSSRSRRSGSPTERGTFAATLACDGSHRRRR